MSRLKVLDTVRHHYTLIGDKYISGFTVAFIMVLPGCVWMALDRDVWRFDPVGYALGSVGLYLNLITNLPLWKWHLFHGYKAPLIFWIGQFFVAFGDFTDSINFSLLLIPVIATSLTFIFLFRSFEMLFKSKAVALCGCFSVAASPLFTGLSTGLWIEPMQLAITSWFIYMIVKASSWDFYFALSQFIIALSLAMLIKVSSPLYIIGPSIAFWLIVFRSNPLMRLNKKNLFFLLVSVLFLFPTAVFYFNNFKDLLDFAHFAATSPLFAAYDSKFDLWMEYLSNGIFLQLTFYLVVLVLLLGIIKTINISAYRHFGGIFSIALFQIALFYVAWITSANGDSRYFLPAVPYFALLICWGLVASNNRLLTATALSLFLIQFAQVTGFTFGLVQLKPSYVKIRPLIREPGKEMHLIHAIMPLATHDSSIIFDLEPKLGLASFQYELAKKDLAGNWAHSCVDVSGFFDINRQEIDTGKINIETAWENILAYHPDFYFTWNSRLSPALVETEMRRNDTYTAATVPARWKIADRM